MQSGHDRANWLDLDELENAIDNLETCLEFLEQHGKPTRWKWATIALHQALYGFAICAVRGTDFASVLRDPNNLAEGKLIGIWEALRRTRSPDYLWPGASPLQTTPEEELALQRLIKEFRDGFEHFRPAAWSIEVSGMPRLFHLVLRVLRFITLESKAVRYYDDAQTTRVERALVGIDRALNASH